MAELGKVTGVWTWQAPRDGEVTPDYPPTDITDDVMSVELAAKFIRVLDMLRTAPGVDVQDIDRMKLDILKLAEVPDGTG